MKVALLDQDKQPIGLINRYTTRKLLDSGKAKSFFKLYRKNKIFTIYILNNEFLHDIDILKPELILTIDFDIDTICFTVSFDDAIVYSFFIRFYDLEIIRTNFKKRKLILKKKKPFVKKKTILIPHSYRKELNFIHNVFNITKTIQTGQVPTFLKEIEQ